ncbi:MAG: HD domain-containing protein [Limnobacter sp.]|nr:HD domain-containing protein [Limnobacter sp.]
MSESPFRSFRETQLPHRFQKAYTFARDAHQLRTAAQCETLQPYVFHPVAMAEGALKAGLSDDAVIAALIHDVVDLTPVTFDHIHSLFEAKVHDLTYDMTCPVRAGNTTEEEYIEVYSRHLGQAQGEAKALKLMDLAQTVVELGVNHPRLCTLFVERNQQLLVPLKPTFDASRSHSALYLRAEYAFKWGTRRVYEKQVEAYNNRLTAEYT